MTREEILKEALKCVNGEREQQYGSPEDSFEVIADLWMTYLEKKTVPDTGLVVLNPEDVAAMMALLKIARICTGKYKGDNWVDLAGYAACGGACQSGSRPAEREPEDEEDTDEAKKRYEQAKKEVESYCHQRVCSDCPVSKYLGRNYCIALNPEEMTMDELAKMLEYFKADDERERIAKAKAVNMHCRRSQDCTRCVVSVGAVGGENLYRLCQEKAFTDMTGKELDKLLARFRVRKDDADCRRCKYGARYIGDEPCCVCNDFCKYEEDTDEQS